MHVLITNDDGHSATGIQALAKAIKSRGDTYTLVAPSVNKSGTSCSLTLDRPLKLIQLETDQYHLDGTPADCVHVALTGLAKVQDYDAVISGINDGANLGDDVIHSGTLGAAIQAHLYGLPALATSLVSKHWENIDTAVATSLNALDMLVQQASPSLWNLNIPNTNTLPQIRMARVGRRTASFPVTQILSPRGERFFFLGAGGDTIEEPANDMDLIQQGYACISPITLDRTDYAQLNSPNPSYPRAA